MLSLDAENQEDRNYWLNILRRMNEISVLSDLDELLKQMLALLCVVAGGNSGNLYLIDPETGTLIYTVVNGNIEELSLLGLRILQEQGLVGIPTTTPRSIVIEDLSSDPRWYRDLDPDLARSIQSAIGFPIYSQETAIGAIQIYNYTKCDLDLLHIIGSRIATDIEKYTLLEDTQRSYRRIHGLIDVIGRLGATLDRDQLLRQLTGDIAQLLDAERSSIFLVDPDTSNLAFHVSYQSTSNNPEKGQDSSRTPAINKIFHNPKQRIAKEPITRPRSAPQGVEGISLVASSAITIPLRVRPILLGQYGEMAERVIGGIMALNKYQAGFNDEDVKLLETLAGQASSMLQIIELYNESNNLFIDAIKALVASIDAKDPNTQGHSLRVFELSEAIAKKLGLSADMVYDIRIGSLLHDVGKIGIPDLILQKPAKLTDQEYDLVMKHPAIGSNIMGEVKSLHNILPAISEHHERLDGSGYPIGLAGDQISVMGRIVAVADVYDAMTSDRPYRKSLSPKAVMEYLEDNSGKLFDRNCVQALKLIPTR